MILILNVYSIALTLLYNVLSENNCKEYLCEMSLRYIQKNSKEKSRDIFLVWRIIKKIQREILCPCLSLGFYTQVEVYIPKWQGYCHYPGAGGV